MDVSFTTDVEVELIGLVMSDNEGVVTGALVGVEEEDVRECGSSTWDGEFNRRRYVLYDCSQRFRNKRQFKSLSCLERFTSFIKISVGVVHID